MKTAKLFLFGMYVHLILSIVVPLVILFSAVDGGWSALGVGAFLFYLLMIAVVQVIGWVCVAMAVGAYRHNEAAKLRKGWKTLKLHSIPFFVLNFIYSFLAWFILVGASRGLMFLLVPIPILITCLMVFQTGCVGICYIMYLRKQPENEGKPSGIHYLLQLCPVADVISTVILLRRYPAKVDNSLEYQYEQQME